MARKAAAAEPILVWIGDGSRYLIGIPARDLTSADIDALADEGDRAALIETLKSSGLWREVANDG